MPATECLSTEQLLAFQLGGLCERDLNQASEHLEECARCRDAVRQFDDQKDCVLSALQGSHRDRTYDVGQHLHVNPVNSQVECNERHVLPAGVADAEGTTRTHLGDFRIIREIGRGGMGVVYEAEQGMLGRRVALKVLPGQAKYDPDSQKRFLREARSAARLHHTNIVPVFGVGRHEGLDFIVMQFIAGVGLDKLLSQLQKLAGQAGFGIPGSQVDLDADAANSVDEATLLLSPRRVKSPDRPPRTDEPHETAMSTSAIIRNLWNGFGLVNFDRTQAQSGSDAKMGTGLASQIENVDTTRPISTRENQAVAAPVAAGTGKPVLSFPPPPAYFRSVALIGAQVADALAHAHGQGVLHRDIKPSNLLIEGSGRVWVADFGLAKAANETDDLTSTGDLVGTLRYMAPERFKGKADGRSDVFSLGLTLYELLALRPACDADNRSQLIRRMVEGDQSGRPALLPGVPRDLETIVLKAMTAEPDHRYQTAAELADDLHRFLSDRPIRARRLSTMERFRRWCRQHPGVALLAASLCVVVSVSLAVVSSLYWTAAAAWHSEAGQRRLAEQARQNEEIERHKAEQAREASEQNLYYSRIAQGRLEWEANHIKSAESILEQCPERRRGWEWHYLKRLCRADLPSDMRHDGWGWRVEFSPDGRWLASAGGGNPFFRNPGQAIKPGEVRVWAIDETGAAVPRLRQTINKHQHLVTAVAFCPASGPPILASGSHDGTVRLSDPASGREIWKADIAKSEGRNPEEKSAEILSLVFTPDGKLLLAGQARGGICILDTASGQIRRRLAEGLNQIRTLAVSPDQQTVAIVAHGLSVQLCDLGTGVLEEPLPHSSLARAVAFSPDGRFLAATHYDGVAVWDARTRQLQRHLTVGRGRFLAAAFSPDGQYLATAGSDAVARLWSLASGKEVLTLRGHRQDIVGLAFSPDGSLLATASHDETAKVWDLTRNPESHFIGRSPDLQNLTWSPDGKELAYAGPRGATFIDAGSGNIVRELPLDMWRRWSSPCARAAFDLGGRRIATVSQADEGMLVLAGTVDGQEICRLGKHQALIRHLAFSADGRRLLSASSGLASTSIPAQLKVWDTSLPAPAATPIFEHQQERTSITAVALDRQGRLLAVAEKPLQAPGQPDSNSVIRLFDLGEPGTAAAARELAPVEGPEDFVGGLCFSPDGTRLAAVGFHQSGVLLCNLETRELVRTRAAVRAGVGLSFSPDGNRLAVGGRDLVTLLDSHSGVEILTLRPPFATEGDPGSNCRVQFSPDGDRLAAMIGLNVVCVWDASPLSKTPAAIQWKERSQRAVAWHLQQLEGARSESPENTFAVKFHLSRLKDGR